MPKKKTSKSTVRGVETITHKGERRVAIPTQDLQAIVPDETKAPVPVSFKKRDPDLDPQVIWHGKYDGDETLTVLAPPLYIQEKIHPRAILDELIAETKERKNETPGETPELFSDFNGVPAGVEKTDFYKHDQNWTNRMISGDSLQVMASLLNREGMRGKVQCVYMDPPYGIKFNSNFQSSTMSTSSKESTREPEMIKAFRDTWKDEIHSYLTYLRDRFLVARDLLSDSGSIFVQIGDQNVHRVRVLLDEVFGEGNFESQITYTSTSGNTGDGLGRATNYLLWYCKNKELRKYRPLYNEKAFGALGYTNIELGSGERMSIKDFERRFNCKFDYERRCEVDEHCRVYMLDNMFSQGASASGEDQRFVFEGKTFRPKEGKHWKPGLKGLPVLAKANRLAIPRERGEDLKYVRYLEDFTAYPRNNVWTDTSRGFASDKIYVVQTGTEIVKRCILMCTDPGDLVLDPTCGSGTTAYVAEQWGRRWITIDTSRVALALARSRIMAARYPWYLLADSEEGKRKEAELSGKFWDAKSPVWNNIKLGFVNKRIPHIMLGSISNNKEIDEIYEKFQKDLEPLRKELNKALSKNWQEWETPREAEANWGTEAKKLHEEWWAKRIERQREIDKSIETHSEFEQLYDKPFEDTSVVRVAGPFTVESTSEHRVLALDTDNNVVDPAEKVSGEGSSDFDEMILNNVKKHGVQQGNKEDRILFDEIERHPGAYICAIAKYEAGKKVRRAGIFIGPEFATVSRASLVAASKEAAEECGCDDVICFGFNYEAMVTDLKNLGKINIIKAKINEELHMGDDTLKGGGNLFVVFGEPDIEITDDSDDPEKIVVKIRGVDVFAPNNAEIRSDGTDNIACWFIDTDYNGESFFVRHAYFCGDRDPYDALKRSLNAEIDKEAWESLHKTVSRPFPRPKNGKIAVKVINGYGDEVMKIFDVSKK